MEGEQLEFDFDESENKNELNGSGEPKRGPVTRICSRCGQPFILSAGTTDDMCWECCQEEKSEDEEQENARLFHGFSRDSKAFIPLETTPKKKTQKRKSLKEYTIPVRLNDEYDKSWIGKKICIKGGRGRGKTGTIVDVHKYRLCIATDDGREYSEIYPDNVFMKPDAPASATNNVAVHESSHRAFDDESGWEYNNGRGRSRMSDDYAIALERIVDGEYEDDENENEIRELEERISKANEEINKKLREVDDEQYASDAQWERNKELISAQKKKADLVRELEEKRYGKAVVNEPSAKYLRGLKKAIDQGGRMKGGKSSGEHSVNESEFMDALKEVGFGRAMCESINNIRKAVFEGANFESDSNNGIFDDWDRRNDYRNKIAQTYFKELYDRISELEKQEKELYDDVMFERLLTPDDVCSEETINKHEKCLNELAKLMIELNIKVNEKIKELRPEDYRFFLGESRLGYSYHDYEEDNREYIAKCFFRELYDKVNRISEKINALEDELTYIYDETDDYDSGVRINNELTKLREEYGELKKDLDAKSKEKLEELEREEYERQSEDFETQKFREYGDETVREYRDEIAKKYFGELCEWIDGLEEEEYYAWLAVDNAIREGVLGEELKELEKKYNEWASLRKNLLDELNGYVDKKIKEVRPRDYQKFLQESSLVEKVKKVVPAVAIAANMALAQPSDNGDDYYQNNYNHNSPAYDVGNDGWDNMTPDHLNAVSQDVGAKVTVVGDSPVADISDMGYLERKKKDVDKYKYVDMDELFSNEVGRVSSDHDRDFVMGFGHGESSNIHEAARLAAAAAKEDFREVMSDEMELINANAGSSSIDLPLSEDDELYDVKYFYDEASKIYHAFVMRVERGYTKWALDHNMESSSSVSERMKRISKIR